MQCSHCHASSGAPALGGWPPAIRRGARQRRPGTAATLNPMELSPMALVRWCVLGARWAAAMMGTAGALLIVTSAVAAPYARRIR